MSSKKVFFILIAAVLLLGIGCGATVYYGDKMLQQRAAKLQELKLEEKELDQQKTYLIKAKKDLEKYGYINDIAHTVVPQDKDQARAVREINKLASESGVALQSITFPSSNLGEKKQTTQSSGGNEDNGNQDTQKSTPATPPITQAQPVSGLKGVYSLQMSIESQPRMTYYGLINFLSKLEKNRRTAQVTNVRITPETSSANSRVTFSLTINIFVKP